MSYCLPIFKLNARKNNKKRRKKISKHQKLGLEFVNIKHFIDQNILTKEQVLSFSDIQIKVLNNKYIFNLIDNKYISILEALNLTNQEYLILINKKMRQNFMLSGQSIKNFLENKNAINYSQSTHQTSIHESASESAKKLSNRYNHQITNNKLDQVINKISPEINKFFRSKQKTLTDKDLDKKETAIRCLERITNIEFTYFDEKSGTSVRELLALAYLAIKDNKHRTGSYNNALANYIDGLYEIQLGDNIILADEGSTSHDDSPICTSGTFNKLIEKLQGIHPDCELRFISTAIAGLKLPIIAKEEVTKYLDDFFEPNTHNYNTCNNLIRSLEQNGIEAIWVNIINQISNRAHDEFKVIYPKKSSQAFQEFLDNAKYTDISNIVSDFKQKNSRYQKQQISNSSILIRFESAQESSLGTRTFNV